MSNPRDDERRKFGKCANCGESDFGHRSWCDIDDRKELLAAYRILRAEQAETPRAAATPDTWTAGMMDAARIVRDRKGKYTLEQTANYLESLCLTPSHSQPDTPNLAKYLSRQYVFSSQADTGEAMAMGKELFEAGKKHATLSNVAAAVEDHPAPTSDKCDSSHGLFACTLPKGHTSIHRAFDSYGTMCAQWWDKDSLDPRVAPEDK